MKKLTLGRVLIKIRELLANRDTGTLETLSTEEASLVCSALYY